MNILFHTNCQGYGLWHFFKNSPDADKFTADYIQNFQIVLGETTREQERDALKKADILFYHAYQRALPWPDTIQFKPNCVMIPLSVFYNGAYFLMENARKEIWAPVLEMARKDGSLEAARFLVQEADLDYQKRWDSDVAHMKAKEEEEVVAPEHRISHWQADGLDEQYLLTKNHPSSILFLRWANLLLPSIGLRPMGDEWESKCRENNNVVGLPCEDWATTAARKHLNLRWGATQYENERSLQFGKELLEKWLAEEIPA